MLSGEIALKNNHYYYRTYARTASNLSMDSHTVQENGTLEENMLAFLNNHSIPIQKSYVSVCHPLKLKAKIFLFS